MLIGLSKSVLTNSNSIVKLTKIVRNDVVNLKIGKFGGLTKAKEARDLCVHQRSFSVSEFPFRRNKLKIDA